MRASTGKDGTSRYIVCVTRLCNNKCFFCYSGRDRKKDEMIPTEEILEYVRRLKRDSASGAEMLIITGGEPTLHPDLPEIIRKAKRYGYKHVRVISNGRMLANEKLVLDLKEAGLDDIVLSLHSHIKADFEVISGAKGSYVQALRGLLNVRKHGIRCFINIVVNRVNYKKLSETVRFFISLGMKDVHLFQVQPFGSSWKTDGYPMDPPETAYTYFQKVFSLPIPKDVRIETNKIPEYYLEHFEQYIGEPGKFEDNVLGRYPELSSYVDGAERIACRGPRCALCYFQGYCRDLERVMKEGDLKSRESPKCIKVMGVKKGKTFRKDKQFTLESFTDFYIQHRHFVKSLRCKRCVHFDRCDGAWVEDIRAGGFKILRPVVEKE